MCPTWLTLSRVLGTSHGNLEIILRVLNKQSVEIYRQLSNQKGSTTFNCIETLFIL